MWIDQEILAEYRRQMYISVWRPQKPVIVMGNGNKAQTEVHQGFAQDSAIPVHKRKGGGGTVVLYDGCIIIGIGLWLQDRFKNDVYFKKINLSILELIKELHPKQPDLLAQRGISDLCYGPKKFGGTSIFRSRNYLLYQASLIFDLNVPLIDSCLQHPSKEPDYRKSRKHHEFLVGLNDVVDGDLMNLHQHFSQKLEAQLTTNLGAELCSPVEKQFAHLQKLSEQD